MMRRLGFLLLATATVAGGVLSACVGNIGNAPPEDTGQGSGPICTDGSLHPGEAPIRRMTSFEYDNTLRDLLGDTTQPAKNNFPKEEEAGGFNNNAGNLTVSDDLANKYMLAAEGISKRATANIFELTHCDSYDDACATAFIASFGKRAFRRPLTEEDRADLTALYEEGKLQSQATFAADGTPDDARIDFTQGIQMVIEAILQSPDFMYRVEPVLPGAPKEKAVRLDSYELASRLSYFLWGSMPDDALFAAADADALSTKEGIAAEARRMLDDPKARLAVGQFHSQWLGYERIQGATKDPAIFPDWSPTIGALMQEETRQFIEHSIFDDAGKLKTLLTASTSYMNADLASFYGLTGSAANGQDFVRVDLDPSQRAGLLTMGSLMAWYAHTNQTSPVHRGKLVREQFLCTTLKPPPKNFMAPDVNPKATTRVRFAQHSVDPACAGCHRLMDPIGFGFENIDAVGRFRSTDNGLPVDASGKLTDSDVDGSFSGAIELADRLATSREVEQCYETQWFRWTQGRGDTVEDTCSTGQIDEAFAASGGDIKALILSLTQTDAFLYRTNGDLP